MQKHLRANNPTLLVVIGALLACVVMLLGAARAVPALNVEPTAEEGALALPVNPGDESVMGSDVRNTPVGTANLDIPEQPAPNPGVPADQRATVTCYDPASFIECSAEQVQAAIDAAGTTPAIVELGGYVTEIDRTIVIPRGADIMLVPQRKPLNWDGDALLRRAEGFTGTMIEVKEGARLSVDKHPLNADDIVKVQSTWKRKDFTTASSPTIQVDGELVLNASEVSGARGLAGMYVGAITARGPKAQVTLNNGARVTNNHRAPGTQNQRGAGNIAVSDGATFVMNDGSKVTKGKGSGRNYAHYGEVGGIGAYNGGRVYINGGEITNNDGWTGGVLGMSWPWTLQQARDHKDDQRNFIQVNNGVILGNQSGFSGGGLFSFGNTVAEMNDGLIFGNTSPNGGGVGTFDDWVQGTQGSKMEIPSTGKQSGVSHQEWNELVPGSFTMNGGTISGNSATLTGGGVNAVSNEVHLNAGRLEKNESELGGGVYVATGSYTLQLENVLVNANASSYIGGGVWVCPTGSMEMHVENGAAILENSARSYGDDLAHDNYGSIGALEVWAANEMLGGSDVTYYRDGSLGAAGWDRYNKEAPVEELFKGEPLQNRGLKTVAPEDALERAQHAATLVITNNKGERGGGIASNGHVIFGHNDETVTDLEVTKHWVNPDDSEYTGERPDHITLQLMRGQVKVGDPVKVTPDEQGNWKHRFENLPVLANGVMPYRVEEIAVDGFDTLTGSVVSEGNNYAQLIVNAARTNLDIVKSWEDIDGDTLPEQIMVDVLQTVGGETTSVQAVMLSAEGGWKAQLTNLPRFKDGEEIHYSVKETTQVPGYTPTYAELERTATGYVARLANTRETTEVSVRKVWEGASEHLPAVTVLILQEVDGKEKEVRSIALNDENGWNATVDKLPTHVGGKKASYSVKEIPVPGYTATITRQGNEFTVTNSKEETTPPTTPETTTPETTPETTPPTTPETTTPDIDTGDAFTNLSMVKQWRDANGQELPETPESVTLRVLQKVGDKEAVQYGEPIVLSAANNWQATLTRLPAVIDGLDVTYTVVEQPVDGFTSDVEMVGEGSEWTATVVNTRDTPPTTTSTTSTTPPTTTTGTTTTTPAVPPVTTTPKTTTSTTTPSSSTTSSTPGTSTTQRTTAPTTRTSASSTPTTVRTTVPQIDRGAPPATLTETERGDDLARTGSPMRSIIAIGGLLALLGAMLLMIRRRS